MQGKCDVCDNVYDKVFTVTMHGQIFTFDSFECAIHSLAPRCKHCECRIIGHGVEVDNQMYCCANCAYHSGHPELKDRA